MELQTCARGSQALVERIERSVQSRTNGGIRNLRVEVVGDSVVLSGRTSTFYTKQLATHAVFSAADDVMLTNDIEVC